MPDRYKKFSDLRCAEHPSSYEIRLRDVGSLVVIAAPHGGGIEPGTSEIALAIAGADLSWYLFEGKKGHGNKDLHITSCNFDEPDCLSLLRAARIVVTVHGEGSNEDVLYVGGRHAAAGAALRAALEPNGFDVREHPDQDLRGLSPHNICNIGQVAAGLQLELSQGLRRSFFHSLSQTGRKQATPRLSQFSLLVHDALLESDLWLTSAATRVPECGRPPKR